MAFIKIYSNEHLDDVGFNRCWNVSFHHKLGKPHKQEIEKAVKVIAGEDFARLGEARLGYPITDKCTKIWFADGDSEGEYLSRNISDDLLKLVNRKWSVNSGNGSYHIDPSKLDTPLVS